jgi:hypothetical protein
MTMLRGYTVPSPGAGDGEYGGFGGYGSPCIGCGPSFAGFAASPATHPYWEGQGIANRIPALNGYGDHPLPEPGALGYYGEDMHSQDVLHSHDGYGSYGEDPSPLPVLPLLLGALAGRLLLGNLRGAAIGAGLGYFFRDSFPKFAGYGAAPARVIWADRLTDKRQASRGGRVIWADRSSNRLTR